MNGSQGLQLARAALRVLTGAGGGTPARSALEARVRVHVEDRLRSGALGTAVLTKLRDEPGDASTAIALPVLADEISRDPAFGDTLNDLLEQLLGGPAAVAAYGVQPAGSAAAGSTAALGSIGLSSVTAHQIPFHPPQAPPPPAAPPAPVPPLPPQVVVVPPMPAYRPYRSSAWLVFMLGLPQFAFFACVGGLVVAFAPRGMSLTIAFPIGIVSLLMALFGLIRGLFLFRGPSSVLLYVGTTLNLFVVVVLLLAPEFGSILRSSF
ncbi:hypothetical protein OHB36_05240 [Streptomyces sp. NBC_00320]|uniref:hypothetical protein n=1 Tax=unclassified Streptomyces TaxID=2593676 RepID=UPI002250A4E1|nr:hypothetical protein [Streptomyces sp. NBC_00320]MCX5146197.1 hypothetical protein [Streptomyces sp. NBC_00320]